MPTKQQYIDTIKDKTKNQFRDRTIALELEIAFNTIVGQLFLKDPYQYDFYVRWFDDVDVVQADPCLDEKGNGVRRSYSVLPCATIQTPDLANGVRYILANKSNNISDPSEELRFYPIPAYGVQTYTDLGLDNIDPNTVGYVVYTNRVEYWNLPTLIEKVRMGVVPSFMAWDNDTEIPLPSGVSAQIITMVLESVQKYPYETSDYKND